MGVLDIGSNTGHLLIVDAFRGAPPVPAHSFKEPLRLAESLDSSACMTSDGIDALVKYVSEARAEAEDKGCDHVLAFATSAVRDAVNVDEVLAAVVEHSGLQLRILPGEDEARLTFLAVRRWFGWSAGRLGVFDIGGGSLELAAGRDEIPDVAISLPLGAGRLTRDHIDQGASLKDLRKYVRHMIGQAAGPLLREGAFDHAVATSKTFRSLARIAGAAPASEGPYVRRTLAVRDIHKLTEQLATMKLSEIADLPGVSANRAHQMLAGAVVAEAAADLTGVDELLICPWALREGVLLEAIDQL